MKNHLYNMFANILNGQLVKRPFVLQSKKKFAKLFCLFYGMKVLF